MSFYSLANCNVCISSIVENSAWQIFETDLQKDADSLCIAVEQIKSNELCFYVNGSRSLYYTALGGWSAYDLDVRLYELCAEYLLANGVLHLHSSYILYRGYAVLFTGPSGIGKTTQAELWRDNEGAEIINGDVTLIRKVDGQYCAFGSPVHGSSVYCENKSAPVLAVLSLRQGQDNHIELLNGFETLADCMEEIYRPPMKESTREILYDTMDGFFSEIPVYRLTCRPDREAVVLVKKTLCL